MRAMGCRIWRIDGGGIHPGRRSCHFSTELYVVVIWYVWVRGGVDCYYIPSVWRATGFGILRKGFRDIPSRSLWTLRFLCGFSYWCAGSSRFVGSYIFVFVMHMI